MYSMYSTSPATPSFPHFFVSSFEIPLSSSVLRYFIHSIAFQPFFPTFLVLGRLSGDRLHWRSLTEYTSNPITTSHHWEVQHSRQASCNPISQTSRTFLERIASTQDRCKRCDAYLQPCGAPSVPRCCRCCCPSST